MKKLIDAIVNTMEKLGSNMNWFDTSSIEKNYK
jgi:hypothetical protein